MFMRETVTNSESTSHYFMSSWIRMFSRNRIALVLILFKITKYIFLKITKYIFRRPIRSMGRLYISRCVVFVNLDNFGVVYKIGSFWMSRLDCHYFFFIQELDYISAVSGVHVEPALHMQSRRQAYFLGHAYAAMLLNMHCPEKINLVQNNKKVIFSTYF